MEEKANALARPAASRSLREAIRKARLEEAEQLDLTADRRDSEIARLELLRAELEGVFAEIPPGDDRFNLVLTPSRPARLWLDLFTYAAIDESSGAYLFVRNSENGRRTLYSSANVVDMADRITRYVAREIVRRERLDAALTGSAHTDTPLADTRPARSGMAVIVSAFLIGLLTGAVALFVSVWLSVP